MSPAICIGCGCDEDHACPMDQAGFVAGCWWVRYDADRRLGVCSACWDLTRAWDTALPEKRTPLLPLIAERYYRQLLFLHEDKGSALAWVRAPHPLLGGRAAYDTILDGDLERVQALVEQLRAGALI